MAGVTRVPARRVIGSHTLTTGFTTSATHTTAQDEGLTVSVTYGAARILRVSLFVHPYASGGAQTAVYTVLRNATVEMRVQTPALATALVTSASHSRIFNGPATGATETFKVQIAAGTANTAVDSGGSANFVRQLVIEDLGPQ